jgi:hypothetical protein
LRYDDLSPYRLPNPFVAPSELELQCGRRGQTRQQAQAEGVAKFAAYYQFPEFSSIEIQRMGKDGNAKKIAAIVDLSDSKSSRSSYKSRKADSIAAKGPHISRDDREVCSNSLPNSS